MVSVLPTQFQQNSALKSMCRRIKNGSPVDSGGARGGARGAPAPLTPRKISYCNLKGLKQEKERKKNDSWNLKVILTQGKENKKKKFLKHQIIFFFHLFYCSSKFSLVPRLTPILQFFSFLISIILFTVYNTFCSILLLNDTRDITNFTIYIFKN